MSNKEEKAHRWFIYCWLTNQLKSAWAKVSVKLKAQLHHLITSPLSVWYWSRNNNKAGRTVSPSQISSRICQTAEILSRAEDLMKAEEQALNPAAGSVHGLWSVWKGQCVITTVHVYQPTPLQRRIICTNTFSVVRWYSYTQGEREGLKNRTTGTSTTLKSQFTVSTSRNHRKVQQHMNFTPGITAYFKVIT